MNRPPPSDMVDIFMNEASIHHLGVVDVMRKLQEYDTVYMDTEGLVMGFYDHVIHETEKKLKETKKQIKVLTHKAVVKSRRSTNGKR